MKDIMNDYQETLLPLIVESLKKGDVDTLMGIQCFDSSLDWTGSKGMESVINVLFREAINVREKAKRLRREIATEEDVGMQQKKELIAEELEKGYIDIHVVRNACDGLTKYLPHLDWLQQNGLLGGYAKYGKEITHLFLPKEMWGSIIDRIVTIGKEDQAYGSAIGRMLSVAYSKKGFDSLKPLILGMNIASSNGELRKDEFIERCCSAVSRPLRFISNMLERDQKKAEPIKAIIDDHDGVILFNPNGIQAVRRWRTLANQRAQERTVGR